MNYIAQTHNAFIVPHGSLRKKKVNLAYKINLKKQKEAIDSTLVVNESNTNQKVFNIKVLK